MAHPSVLGAITYEAEASWAEDIDTTATLRLPIISPVDTSGLVHEKLDSQRVVQYRNDRTKYILGTMGGSFTTEMYLPGHGSTTSGATTITAYGTFLGYVFGNAAVSAASGTTLTGGTAAAPTTTASGTFNAGSLCFVGSLGDARGSGQGYAISTHDTTTLNLLTALTGAPTNGDVLYSATMVYPSEAPTTTSVTGLRFLLQTANLQYLCHGCFPTAVSITGLNPGELPKISVTWGVSWWEYKASTFPSTVSTDSSNPGAVAAGSVFVNTLGTATSATRSARTFSVEYSLGMQPIEGVGGVNQYQKIVGARRLPDTCKVTWSEDADAATTSPTIPGYGTGTDNKHILYTSSTAAGSRLAIYLPNVCVSSVAIQKAESNLNRLTFEGMTACSSTTTNDLTLSHFRMGLG